MFRQVIVDPMTRIEGHLRFVTCVVDDEVVDAHCTADMLRGIEKALIGHDARVAQQMTQRVCGVCPYGHAEAAALALEDALDLRPNPKGQRLRNLIVGADQLQDYLLHFYTLCALDFIDDQDQPDRDLRPSSSQGLTPIDWETDQSEQHKPDGKYSWSRAPRYAGELMKVGPVARIVNTYHADTNPTLRRLVEALERSLRIGLADYASVMGRHLARLINALLILERLAIELTRIVRSSDPSELARDVREALDGVAGETSKCRI